VGSGFLGTRATWAADLNLIAQLFILVVLAIAAIQARKRNVDAHENWVLLAIVANAFLIVAVMNPAFFRLAPDALRDPAFNWQIIMWPHMIVGGLAELLGLYIVLALKTDLPEGLRARNIRGLMRLTFVLWMVALLGGTVMYLVWYT